MRTKTYCITHESYIITEITENVNNIIIIILENLMDYLITSAPTVSMEHYYFMLDGDWWSQFTNMLRVPSGAGLEVRSDLHSNF